jgi:signal transduction histidine kinase
VVSDIVELMQTRAAEIGVKLEWRPDATLPTLQCDSEAMHRAILNVVTNAIDACDGRADGRVEVSTHYLAENDRATIVVNDNGTGIDAEQLPKIFQAFVSGKGARGTGLGLPVSQKIVKEHGGRIQVESTAGQGSRFTIEIPVVLEAESSVRETNITAEESEM